MRYYGGSNTFLDRTVTCDETWVHSLNAERKCASMQWKHRDSPRVRKFKQTLSANKMLAYLFWDSRGVLFVDFILHEFTVNSEVYCNQLRQLRRSMQNRRRDLQQLESSQKKTNLLYLRGSVNNFILRVINNIQQVIIKQRTTFKIKEHTGDDLTSTDKTVPPSSFNDASTRYAPCTYSSAC